MAKESINKQKLRIVKKEDIKERLSPYPYLDDLVEDFYLDLYLQKQNKIIMTHTKGRCRINKHAKGNVETEKGRSIASCAGYSTNIDNGEHIEENIANAQLIAEAFNVTNETGFTPRQLADKVKELQVENGGLKGWLKQADTKQIELAEQKAGLLEISENWKDVYDRFHQLDIEIPISFTILLNGAMERQKEAIKKQHHEN